MKHTSSVVAVFSALDSTIQAHSIKECYCLGRFDPKHNNTKPRPILVHFVRMADVSSVLAKRGSLKRPYFIKPFMSTEQRKIESILLKERWNLIQSGISRTQIRIRDSNIYVNKKLHGKVVDSTFMSTNTATNTANFSPIVSPSNYDQLSTMPVVTTILSSTDTVEPPSLNTTESRPIMHCHCVIILRQLAPTIYPYNHPQALMNPVNDYAITTHYSYGTRVV